MYTTGRCGMLTIDVPEELWQVEEFWYELLDIVAHAVGVAPRAGNGEEQTIGIVEPESGRFNIDIFKNLHENTSTLYRHFTIFRAKSYEKADSIIIVILTVHVAIYAIRGNEAQV